MNKVRHELIIWLFLGPNTYSGECLSESSLSTFHIKVIKKINKRNYSRIYELSVRCYST